MYYSQQREGCVFAQPLGGPRCNFVTNVCVLLFLSFGSVLVNLSEDETAFILRHYLS